MPTNCGFDGVNPIICCNNKTSRDINNGTNFDKVNRTNSTITTTILSLETKNSNYTNPPGVGHKARASAFNFFLVSVKKNCFSLIYRMFGIW